MLNNDSLRKSLNYAFLKSGASRAEINLFKTHAIKLLSSIQENKAEEFYKIQLIEFLTETYYKNKHFINVKENIDLVIHNDKTANSSVGVIIEVKRPNNSAEMVSADNLNKKALQELVLYYLRERISHKNIHLKHLIITNINEWFIFDARIFEQYFAENKALVKDFLDFENKTLAGHKTKSFYDDIAKPAIEACKAELNFTHFNLPDYKILLEDADNENDKELIPLFKLLSPEHLLKLSFSNDANSLNQAFYNELLHLIGVEEVKEAGKKLIKRKKESERNSASLLEQSINKIKSRGEITEEAPLFEMAIELSITWINRILFLKLLEAQLLSYHKNDKAYQFFNSEKLTCFSDLNHLFFEVLALSEHQRDELTRQQFSHVPYLNSSLFERTELEGKALEISVLRRLSLPILSSTVLKDERGKKLMGELDILSYLFSFLEAYDFGNDNKEAIKSDNKSLITASALGLIFEKINGYKDGSFFTPSVITMYMSRETLRLAVLQKFNQEKGWNCQNFEELYNQKKDLKEANAIINRLKICDPAVGSGHFLVSVLNEIIAIKAELEILLDRQGKRLYYQIEVLNDELKISHLDDNNYVPFEYKPKNKESRRIQETLFHEKQTIIENCLFGVDINPNSVKICRLRLWIELLKSAYYKDDGKLETLPNIDINIQIGNSLISRFPLDADLKTALKRSNANIEEYKNAFYSYQNAKNRIDKNKMEGFIKNIKTNFYAEAYENDPNKKLLSKVIAAKDALMNISLVEETEIEKVIRENESKKLKIEIARISYEIENKNKQVYQNSFEWRFEFPEALDNNGDFVGFDVIIGNPPYIQIQNFSGEDIQTILQNKGYETFEKMGDIYALFIEKGVSLLKQNGLLSFITSNKWMRAAYGQSLRQFLITKTQPLKLIDFAGYQVFDSATVDSNILIIQNGVQTVPRTSDFYACTIKNDYTDRVSLVNYFDTHSQKMPKMSENSWLISSDIGQQIKEKIETKGTPLKEWDISINYGIKTGFNEAFIIDTETKERLCKEDAKSEKIIKPVLRGRDIKPYADKWDNLWIIFIPWHFPLHKNLSITGHSIEAELEFEKQYPAIYRHLTKFKPELSARNKAETGIRYEWYALQRCAATYYKEFEKKKIIWQEIVHESSFVYDDKEKYYCLDTARIMTGKNLKFLLCILNSKLFFYAVKNFYGGGGLGEHGVRMKHTFFESFAIPKLSTEQQKPYIKLVDKILTAKKSGKDTHVLETQIDKLVYELYGLTADEIKIIEGVK